MARRVNGEGQMKNPVTETSTVRKAYGIELDKPVDFEYTYDKLSAYEDIPEDEQLSNEEVLTAVNARRVASARAAYQTKALAAAGINRPTLEDPKVQFSTMVKALMASGKGREEAETWANTALGTSF